MTPTQLRQYQLDQQEAIAQALQAGTNRVLVKSPTGTGKTVMFAALLTQPVLVAWLAQFPKHDRKMLVVAHREELLEQAAYKIQRANPDLLVMIEQGDRHASRYADVIVASIQTLAARQFARLKRLLVRATPRVVIIDECFPAGTLVDGRPIENILAGDMVRAVDPATGRLEYKRVLWTGSRTAGALITVHMADGRHLTCTPRHKVWTARGWVLAGALLPTDTIASAIEERHASDTLSHMLPVPAGGHVDPQGEDRPLSPPWPDVLFGRVQRQNSERGSVGAYGANEPQARVSEDDRTESDAAQVRQDEDERHIDCDGLDTLNARRERSAVAVAAAGAGLSARMADRGRYHHAVAREDAGSVSDLLQVGHCEQRHQDRRRSRRQQPLIASSTGRQEGPILSWARVDHLEVHQPGRDGEFGGLCRGGLVYDLEVEDFHTFLVDGLVVSNCHHAAASTYRTALVHLGFLPAKDASDKFEIEAVDHDDLDAMNDALKGWDAVAPKDRLLIGVTATPNRSDAVGLGCVFQSLVYSYSLKQAIEDGWLVPIQPWSIETDTDLTGIKTTAGDYNQKQLAEAVNTAQRNELALAAWRQYANRLATLAFTVDVAHAHQVADRFTQDGVRAVAISGDTNKDERRLLLRQYQEGTIDLIANCMVLTEGTDLPRTACILHLKPTQSATLYEQMTGRGLRLYPDKPACIVIDLVDIAKRHSLQTAPTLYGLPTSVLAKGEDLRSMDAVLDEFRQAHPNVNLEDLLGKGLTLAQLKARATTFDVWAVPSLGTFGVGRMMNWIKIAADLFRLSFPWSDGTETVSVEKDLLGKWAVVSSHRSHETKATTQHTIAADVASPEEAASMAEHYVQQERQSVLKLKATDAAWRSRPASQKQMDLLRRWTPKHMQPHIPKNLTMGAASDAIDLLQAGRRR